MHIPRKLQNQLTAITDRKECGRESRLALQTTGSVPGDFRVGAEFKPEKLANRVW